MLSILIPTYNYDVTQLVTTLHTQATKLAIPFEIIVIDDCSTNQKIIESNTIIKEKRQCIYLKNNTNKGRTATRNLLANTATFDWLLFLDADVLPQNEDFIASYVKELKTNHTVIYGGVAYATIKPTHEKLLRWVYGNKRENKSVKIRNKSPYNIISQNLCIKKEVFKKANTLESNKYGLDIYFSYKLKNLQASIKHIQNPVIHLGLENTTIFIKKSLQSVETTLYLEQEDKMDLASRPLQKGYKILRNFRLTAVYVSLIKRSEKKIISNLHTTKPSLLLFDLYRLYHYTKLKRDA